MKAIGFNRPLPADHPEALLDLQLPEPTLNPRDILVEVRAISVNPADVKVRASHQPAAGAHRILGWDAAGVVRAVGTDVQNFREGDEVWYAGLINRPGSYAQLQAVDERIVAKKPASLDFAQAAALPLTTLTAWETLFDRLNVANHVPGAAHALLLIGGAGGVGSVTIQLAKALTDMKVIATASREESSNWVKQLGADHVVDHRQPLPEQVKALGIGEPGFVFSTNHTETHLRQIVDLIAPQGRIALIDDPASLDVNPLKGKSLSLHWEFMFTRPMFQTADMARQGEILQQMAELVDSGKVRSTLTHTIDGINAANLRDAHQRLERGDMIGKLVLQGW